jgi:tol-pal system protein YbgF
MRVAPRAVLLGLAFSAVAGSAHSAIFDDEEARARIEALRRQVTASQQAIDERLARIDAEVRDRRALVDLAGQIESLKNDVARMRGQVEVLLNQSETAEKRQKDLYLDIDTRLRKLEQSKEVAASAEKPADAPVSAEETKAYEAALNQFKLGNYPLAISALQGLLVTYPNSRLGPNAQYWIGMAYAAQRDYRGAIAAQQKVLNAWPNDPKAPDAMLNIANSQEALGDKRGAQKTLEGLYEKYPASQAAASARQRLPKR